VADDGATDVAAAERLEREAQQLLDNGHRADALTMALDQLHADRANGESLDSAIRRLREAIGQGRTTRAGGTQT
jgi:hypothetical protein